MFGLCETQRKWIYEEAASQRSNDEIRREPPKKKSLLYGRAAAVKTHEQNTELDFIVLFVVFIVWWILAGAVRASPQNTYFLIIHLIGFVRDHFVHRLFDDFVFQRSFASRARCIRIYVLHWPWSARHQCCLFSVRLRLHTLSRKLIFLAMSFRHALSLPFYQSGCSREHLHAPQSTPFKCECNVNNNT